ncbi:MAG: DUF3800 domain-containing protein [Oscillospiraceae bacterium]|nr:DUF3800 domain-containing protein [Oscillospiraceae bacterium]
MKIYFDESGQSGCVLQKDDLLNFQTQPTFALAAVVVNNEKDEKILIEKYQAFKRKYKISGEIKGSDLLVRKRNAELNYMLKHIFDNKHFYIILYDKKFYISTMLLLSLYGIEYQETIPEHFYVQASFLSKQKDDFFVQYLKYIQNLGQTEFIDYLNFLINYEYSEELPENAAKIMANKILDENITDKCYQDFMTFGWYDNPQITNLINMNALAELITFIKVDNNQSNSDIEYIHDNIKEFSDTMRKELKNYSIDIKFEDSKDNDLLQIADNIVSVVRHAYDKMIFHYIKEEPWLECSEWDMKLISKVLDNISINKIKFTVPLNDWAATITTGIMFSITFPKHLRNNMSFNYFYAQNLEIAIKSISMNSRLKTIIMERLKY